jgi:hypothetical protein
MTTTGWVVLGVVNLPVYFVLGTAIFRSWEDFGEAVSYWIKPDFWSLFRGEYVEDMVAEIKLGIWLALCCGAVYGEGYLVERFFF